MIAYNEPIKDKLCNYKTILRVRLVRVTLLSGETEILITSLLDELKYPNLVFISIYIKRWGIEIRYDVLKNSFLIEHFSGLSEIVIPQDFFITLLIVNMEVLLREQVNKEVKVKNHFVNMSMNVNISTCVSLLRDKIADLILGQHTHKVLDYLTKYLFKTLSLYSKIGLLSEKQTNIELKKA